MKYRWVMVVSLLLSMALSLWGMRIPRVVLAATAYGAEDGNNTGNSIGGGDGYSEVWTGEEDTIDYIVDTTEELISAVTDASSGDVIFVEGDATIDMTGEYDNWLNDHVTLCSDRGYEGAVGGLIYDSNASDNNSKLFLLGGHDHIQGLRFQGPDQTVGSPDGLPLATCFWLAGNHALEVDNCEFYGWTISAVSINVDGTVGLSSGDRSYIHHSYFHHNRRDGDGHAVTINHASCVVEACNFDYGQDFIYATRDDGPVISPASSFESRYNTFGSHIDGTTAIYVDGGNDIDPETALPYGLAIQAGRTEIIHHNTFDSATDNSVSINGIPQDVCSIYNNWTYVEETSDEPNDLAFHQELDNLVGETYEGEAIDDTEYLEMQVEDNWYGSTPPTPPEAEESETEDPGLPTYTEEFESYTDNTDCNVEVCGSSWYSNVFQSDKVQHSVTSIWLYCYREGSPGTITVSLRESASNAPLGEDLCSGTLDASSITDNATVPQWYEVEMGSEYSMEPATYYTIVVRAPSSDCDDDDVFHWIADCTDPTVGEMKESTNNGATWGESLGYGAYFQIWGYSSMRVSDVHVFTGYQNEGDWIFVFRYYNVSAPWYQTTMPSSEFYFELRYEGEGIAKVSMPAWGYKPGSIYLAGSVAQSYNWGDAGFSMAMVKYGDTSNYTYCDEVSWTSSIPLIDQWLEGAALSLESFYSAAFIDDISTGWQFTDTGSATFLKGIPELDEVRPELFNKVDTDISGGEVDQRTDTYQGTISLQDMMGDTYYAMVANFADNWNLPISMVSNALWVFFCAGMIFASFGATSKGAVSVSMGTLLLAVGAKLGFVSVLITVFAGSVLALLLVYMIFWRNA